MILTGLERLARRPSLLNDYLGPGARVGLVANPTALSSALEPAAFVLSRACAASGARLSRLFGPEHGYRGEAQAGERVADYVDPESGLPVVSLYGESKRPDPARLADLDLVVYDLQDAGLRWYTYLGTLTRLLEALAGLPAGSRPGLLVLDRPNPLSGEAVEGPGLQAGFESLVGPRDLPIRHGLTLGEYALMQAGPLGLEGEVRVVTMEGWERRMDIADCGLPWVAPSPNLPSPESLRAYAATCLLEGCNVSEGRGTTKPFETFGAPWVDGPSLARAVNGLGIGGLRARPLFFVPSFSKYAGELCQGAQLYIERRSEAYGRLVEIGYFIITILSELYPADFAALPPWKEGGKRPLSLLWGDDSLADMVAAPAAADGRSAKPAAPGRAAAYGSPRSEAFKADSRPFLLYA